MADYILLMHGDTTAPDAGFGDYIATLRQRGAFAGGSAIGPGEAHRKAGPPGRAADHLTGFLRINAADLAEARTYLAGNPVFEAGGTVEIRELPQD